jgi:hypothetical protein
MKWKYNNNCIESISDLPEGTIGFVYEIIYASGMRYIGRKNIYSKVTSPLLKSGLKRTPETCKDYVSSIIRPRKKKEEIVKYSNWLVYNGSSKLVPEYDEPVQKTIIDCCRDKNCISYLEEKLLFAVDAAVSDKYYNKSIGGRHFDNSLDGLIK